MSAPTWLRAAKPLSSLRIVVQDEEGQPVARASVVLRTLKGKKQNKVADSFQLRTSQEGTAPFPPVKQGAVLIQVVAQGFQTWGEKVQLTEEEQTLTVTLQPPQEQFSVHEDGEEAP